MKAYRLTKLWPINDWWYYHAGATEGNSTLVNVTRALDKRYGPSNSAAQFAEKAQLGHYENTRAQFENFAASGWSNHKMTLYWMLDSHWPSFFGHIIDYYLKTGGAYFGAKQGLKPISIVYDYYATGDRSVARIHLVNQTLTPLSNVTAYVSFVNLDGSVKLNVSKEHLNMNPISSTEAMTVPRVRGLSPAFFVRCRLKSSDGRLLADNVYWQSTTDDDLGSPETEDGFRLTQRTWADLTALNNMPAADVAMSSNSQQAEEWVTVTVTLTNHSQAPAFFMRAEVIAGGDEILPILWDDNYVTLFAGETKKLQARYKVKDSPALPPFVRLQGHNVAVRVMPLGG
jgi:exo-1,4-beta-D-glucosaminidase